MIWLKSWLIVGLCGVLAAVSVAAESVPPEATEPETAAEQSTETMAEQAEQAEQTPDSAEEAAEPPAQPAPASPLPDYGDAVVISNELGTLEITSEQAAVRRFRLRGVSEIQLPDHYLKDSELDRQLEEHLAVMGVHHPTGPLHNWLGGLNLTPVGPNRNRGARWEVVERTPQAVTFEHLEESTGVRYAMRYVMRPGRPTVDVTLLIRNEGEQAVDLSPVVYPINGVHQDVGRNESYYLTVAEHRGGPSGDLVRRDAFPATNGRTDISIVDGTFDYFALKSRFFAAIWKPQGIDLGPEVSWTSALSQAVDADEEAATSTSGGGPGGGGPGGGPGAQTAAVDLSPVAGKPHRLQVFAQGYEQDANVAKGDRNLKRQAFITATYTNSDGTPFRLNPGDALRVAWNLTVTSMRGEDLSRLTTEEQRLEYTDGFHRFFRILSSILAWMLLALAAIPGVGYGLGVILLTILIKSLLYRTTFKQQKSMLAMQKLGPELKRIQEQYKSDPQTRNAKTMELWKKHGVNPLGGCLPIFIQMPIFIALYQAFSHVAELRGESFLWIADLTLPDQVAYLGSVAGFNITLNILPILYMIISLFMTFSNKPPANGGNDQAAQMMKMMRWMPVMFGVIFYNMPSGLVLYFTMSALISTIELKWIRHTLGANKP